jgi:hypothetical protein
MVLRGLILHPHLTREGGGDKLKYQNLLDYVSIAIASGIPILLMWRWWWYYISAQWRWHHISYKKVEAVLNLFR